MQLVPPLDASRGPRLLSGSGLEVEGLTMGQLVCSGQIKLNQHKNPIRGFMVGETLAREFRGLAQAHTVCRQQSWDLNSSLWQLKYPPDTHHTSQARKVSMVPADPDWVTAAK